MKNLGVTLALAAALAVGTVSAGEAEAKGRRDGAHPQRHAAAQHHRAGPRKHVGAHKRAAPRKHAGAHHRGEHRGRAHQRLRAAKRFSRFKRHQRRHWRAKHRPHARRYHRPHRRVRHIHVVPEYAPAYSRALEIETNEFRFSVNASG